MEVVKNGVLMQERPLPKQKCAICNSKLIMQVYMYDHQLTKVVHCKKCNTYSHLKKPKNYKTFPEELLKKKQEK